MHNNFFEITRSTMVVVDCLAGCPAPNKNSFTHNVMILAYIVHAVAIPTKSKAAFGHYWLQTWSIGDVPGFRT